MAKFIVAALLATVLTNGMTEECNESIHNQLNRCFANLKNLVAENVKDSKLGDKSTFCALVRKEETCVITMPSACLQEFPERYTMNSIYYNYFSDMCTDRVYMNMVPCFEDERREFEECFPGRKINPDDTIYFRDICDSVDELLCVLRSSREYCKNGLRFGERFEHRLDSLQYDICYPGVLSGTKSSNFEYSCLILALLTVLLLSNKSNI